MKAESVWTDNFDLDLLKIVPDATAIMKPVRDFSIYTHGKIKDGVFYGPESWRCSLGSPVAYFGSDPIAFTPADLEPKEPVCQLTVDLALRDCWGNQYVMVVDDHLIWDPSAEADITFRPLMNHFRQHRKLPETYAQDLLFEVRMSLHKAVANFVVRILMSEVVK